VAGQLNADPEVVDRLHQEYRDQAALVTTDDRAGDAAGYEDVVRQIHLGVLEHKRRAVTELRDRNQIDDIVLREVQASMDLEEVRLLGPADTE
jgi:CPA1 family monovalent cation:H+ antiporter